MQEFTGLEIFRAGNYGEKGNYTEADLDDMAAYTEKLHKAPFTSGHVGIDDSKPALGWVKKVYRKGKSLFADGVIADELKSWIEQGFYENVSAEVYPDFAGSGKKYLRAVAILGAGIPEIKGMTGLSAALFSDSKNGEFVTFEKSKQEAIMAEPTVVTFSEAQVQDRLTVELLKKENELTLKFSEIQKTTEAKVTVLEAKLKVAEDKAVEFAEKATGAEVEKFVEGLIVAKKTTPALKDALVGQLKKAAKLDTVLFSEMKANMEAALPVIEFGEVEGTAGEADKDAKFSETAEKLNVSPETVKKYEGKKTYNLGGN